MTGLGNIDDVYKHYLVVIEENKQLKELLKECREHLCYHHCERYTRELLDRIDNAIGEKKQ